MMESMPSPLRSLAALLLGLGLVLVPALPGEAQQTAPANKAEGVPDFWQYEPRGGFANGGRDYCCPVAASNYLLYFAQHGYGKLLPNPAEPAFQAQIEMIDRLASRDYFGTDPLEGTGPGAVLRGVRRYVEESGYQCRRLEYEGWRPVGGAQQGAVRARLPQRDWLQAALADPDGAVWLNVGWYVPGAAPGEWKRVGGHWLTLAGWKEETDGPALLIRNSLIAAAQKPDAAASTVRLTPAPEGEIVFPNGTNRETAGMDRVSGPGLPTKPGRYAFLDAAIVLVIGNR